MVNINKVDEIVRKIRGEVLSEAILVELDLVETISDYFFKENSEKSRILYWEILNTRNLGFDDKIRIFNKIPTFKKRKNYHEMKVALTFIKTIRNQLAHWDIKPHKCNKKKIVIYDPIHLTERIIDSKTLEEFDNAIYTIHKNMCKNHYAEKSNLKRILD